MRKILAALLAVASLAVAAPAHAAIAPITPVGPTGPVLIEVHYVDRPWCSSWTPTGTLCLSPDLHPLAERVYTLYGITVSRGQDNAPVTYVLRWRVRL